MFLTYTFDIQTKQPVYAICDAKSGNCVMLTTSITTAIKKLQQK